ncbi:MAG TPA: peptidylprolyl isomerase [Pseudomonadota bacterium]|nr:peptidylprolyl isomerase [Xanthomonadales bacterium]HQW64062.1 peptidylprolyl isomerase [Pseudomonadota bacterium]MBP6692001.1 peptidylprolyl isomerase [Xanthomonadales bacterium]MBP7416974.1 peptidylprolyl isomerase [Xanthomonadales bacterium]HQX23503.1 peptidylprolyl isomerase [Pseudomonadota bacterium]
MTRFLALVVLALALAALGAAQGARAQALSTDPVDRIVAVVDEDVILQSELDRAVGNILAQYAGRPGQLPAREVIERQVLERLITIRLQLARAEQTGIRVNDTELDQSVMRLAQQNNVSLDQLRASLERDGFSYTEFRDTMRDELLVQRLRQRFVQSRVNVTDTEVDILLASESLKRGEVRLSHILVGVPDGASAAQIQAAREKAEMVMKEIDGGLDFASAAIRFSDGQQALEGGDLGWRKYNEVPDAFADQIAGMQPGEVTQPMRGPSGFHILKLVEVREQQQELVREYNARHIMVNTSELVTADDALATVRDIRRRLEAGTDFAELAKEFSDDNTTANLGGDMGWFEIGAYGTRVEQVLGGLDDGELSEPFQTEVGWHLMQRLGTREADVTDERRREQAREIVRNRKAEEEYDLYLRQLRGEAYIENRLTEQAEPAADSTTTG